MSRIIELLPGWLQPYAKAAAAMIGVIASSLLLVLGEGETLSQITTYEWIVIVVSVVGTTGLTWATPNLPTSDQQSPAPPGDQ